MREPIKTGDLVELRETGASYLVGRRLGYGAREFLLTALPEFDGAPAIWAREEDLCAATRAFEYLKEFGYTFPKM